MAVPRGKACGYCACNVLFLHCLSSVSLDFEPRFPDRFHDRSVITIIFTTMLAEAR